MFHAVQEQMRPILMMTLSACIGLLPAAISTGIGSQVQRPLATVIVGGMLIGPIMLLMVVPALQTFLLDRGRRDARPPPPRRMRRALIGPGLTPQGARVKAIVVGIVLCAAIAGPAAFAKPAHSHHVRRAGANFGAKPA